MQTILDAKKFQIQSEFTASEFGVGWLGLEER